MALFRWNEKKLYAKCMGLESEIMSCARYVMSQPRTITLKEMKDIKKKLIAIEEGAASMGHLVAKTRTAEAINLISSLIVNIQWPPEKLSERLTQLAIAVKYIAR